VSELHALRTQPLTEHGSGPCPLLAQSRQPYLSAFKQRLQDLGWIDGRNVQIEYHFTGGVTERIRVAARELVALAPDVIFATTNPAVAALLQETRTVPIVFTLVSDSVGSGFVPNLAHPGGNITGFHNFEPD
jgi:putative ABC transport system substrate-binding protein